MPTGPVQLDALQLPNHSGADAPRIRQRYEQIADHLTAELRAGRLQPGDRLPGERELAQRLGVGRASVREALGALQVRGLVETRRGAGSSVAVTALQRLAADAPGPELALPADASPAALLDARSLLEPGAARLAALAARDLGGAPALDVAGLEELLSRMASSCDPDDPAQRRAWSDADREFHRRIAAATGNPVLATFGEHLAALMDQPLWQRLRDDSIGVPGRTTLQLAEHRLIAAAIAEGDPDAAELHARLHLTRARRFMALD